MTQHAQGLSRLAFGAVAGFAGTLAIQAFMTANQKWFPSAAPPIRQDPGEFMVESAVVEHVVYGIATVAAYRWLQESA